MERIEVAVNGYVVIGTRVADAVVLQPDLELVGVADVSTDHRGRLAAERGYRLFGSTPAVAAMRAAGLEPARDLGALLAIVTPENVDAIRAVSAAEPDGERSIALTDEALGARPELVPAAAPVAG